MNSNSYEVDVDLKILYLQIYDLIIFFDRDGFMDK